ncbi:rod shape-determining protein RodA [Parvularcula bermudensis HTCC2503]|uniref:Peptidoglycan glycosyltransferase MrdB n=2 Tax=Parvularcula TaxID=208215 RepID=E0TB77_PARBH|nr:rod shape-determining protein RodA [Parvularcula bermudensis HTCC2503]
MGVFQSMPSLGRRSLVELGPRIARLHWPLILVLTGLAGAGVLTLYSVSLGDMDEYAKTHLIRYFIGAGGLFIVAMIPLRVWLSLAYPLYAAGIVLLLMVPVFGEVVNGSQRWIAIGGFRLQPSEMMKIALVMALARYYHGLEFERVSTISGLLAPLGMIAVPVGLVFIQPDLGTALLIGFSGVAMILLAGLSWRYILVGVFAAFFGIAGGIQTGLVKAYQWERVTAFLDPTYDPLGANFHANQSKIAIGSGGVEGKGMLEGTQSQLGFLPEKHTDFIFTIFGEEFGLRGALLLLGAYLAVFLLTVHVARSARSHFGRLMSLGIGVTLVLYVLVNTGMVMGLAPVVGVPLPLVSYGGTVMLAMMGGFGLVLSTWIDRDQDTLRTRGWKTDRLIHP